MKSVLLSFYFPRSIRHEGAGTLLDSLGRVLVNRGYRVTVFAPLDVGEEAPYTIVGYTQEGSTSYRTYLRGLEEMAGGHDRVVLFQNSPVRLPFTPRTIRDHTNVIHYFGSPCQPFSELFRPPYSFQYLKHWLAKNALWAKLNPPGKSHCIVGTQYQKDQLLRLGVSEGLVHVIPLGLAQLNQKHLPRKRAREYYSLPEGPLIGYLGHYSPIKGVPVLLSAFEQLVQRMPEARLALAWSGKGEDAARVKRMMDKEPLRERVSQMGIVDANVFLSALDVCVLPFVHSSFPHFPLVLLEAFAAGTPVITSDLGGLSEIVEDGTTGLLVAPDDPEALAAAMREILEDADLRNQISQNQKEAFETNFSIEAVFDRLEELL